jgi:SAM-dependent methyltransferase
MSLEELFYKTAIDPLLRSLRRCTGNMIQEHSSVLDIACGTGNLLVTLSAKCSEAVGIDLSELMIASANRTKDRKRLTTIDFQTADAADLSRFGEKRFDYAVLSMALHQFPGEIRTAILGEAAKTAKNLILADYTVPRPGNLFGLMSLAIEFLAGIEHYQSYLSYYLNGGIEYILEEGGLTYTEKKLCGSGVFTVYSVNTF